MIDNILPDWLLDEGPISDDKFDQLMRDHAKELENNITPEPIISSIENLQRLMAKCREKDKQIIKQIDTIRDTIESLDMNKLLREHDL